MSRGMLSYNAVMDSMVDVIKALQQGEMIVLVDDEDRENEGDLVCAAEFATPKVVNFMLREGRGMMCVALAASICDALDLGPISGSNTSLRSTAYTVTVDAMPRYGVTTGVSASDRAMTSRLLADAEARPADFARPGHVQPLRAREGGSLVRTGQTEGSVDLCRIAGLRPAAVIIEVMNEDGTMSRRPELEKLCEKHKLKMCSVADVIEYRMQREKLVERIESVPFENEFGSWRLIGYRSRVDPLPHVALCCGEVGQLDDQGCVVDVDDPVLVRMHSQNLLGDVFHDHSQPSAKTLEQAMAMIQREGRGAVVYLRHERMGTGLLKALQTAQLPQEHELAGEDRHFPGISQKAPGLEPPSSKMDYGVGSQILRDLGVRQMRLITKHPFQLTALSGFGLNIEAFVAPED